MLQKWLVKYYPDEVRCIDDRVDSKVLNGKNQSGPGGVKEMVKDFQRRLTDLCNDTLCGIAIAADVKPRAGDPAPPGRPYSRERSATTGGRSGQVRLAPAALFARRDLAVCS